MKKATRERQSTPREWQNVDQHRAILRLRFFVANRYFSAGDAASFSVCSRAVNRPLGRLPARCSGPGSRAAHRARLRPSRPARGGLPSLTLPQAVGQRCTPCCGAPSRSAVRRAAATPAPGPGPRQRYALSRAWLVLSRPLPRRARVPASAAPARCAHCHVGRFSAPSQNRQHTARQPRLHPPTTPAPGVRGTCGGML